MPENGNGVAGEAGKKSSDAAGGDAAKRESEARDVAVRIKRDAGDAVDAIEGKA